jgi:hypothetical protein
MKKIINIFIMSVIILSVTNTANSTGAPGPTYYLDHCVFNQVWDDNYGSTICESGFTFAGGMVSCGCNSEGYWTLLNGTCNGPDNERPGGFVLCYRYMRYNILVHYEWDTEWVLDPQYGDITDPLTLTLQIRGFFFGLLSGLVQSTILDSVLDAHDLVLDGLLLAQGASAYDVFAWGMDFLAFVSEELVTKYSIALSVAEILDSVAEDICPLMCTMYNCDYADDINEVIGNRIRCQNCYTGLVNCPPSGIDLL